MYESITYESILKNMLARIPSEFDKREGSIIYDALAPAAAELAQLYIHLDGVIASTFADTAGGEYLDRRCAERGITRKEATHAIVKGAFVPSDVNVFNKRFRCGESYYTAMGDDYLICDAAGDEANGITGTLIPVDHVEGLESAEIIEVLVPGEAEENDDELRERYFNSISSQAFGGNVADYEEKTNAIDGVGGVKVTPVWNGGGTVLLTIISSDYNTPSEALIGTVQARIDAIAPIGHLVTVKGVESVKIDINANITYQDGWNWDTTGEYIKAAVDEYFMTLAESWDQNDNLIVRISGIEQKILACAGVIDIQNTAINGLTSNIQLEANCIPIRGDVIG